MIPPAALWMLGAVTNFKARRLCGDSNYLRVVYCTERELSRKEMLLIMPLLVSNKATEPQLNKKKRIHRRGAGREKKSPGAHARSIYRSIVKFRARAGSDNRD
jgi:hypothetical protein